MSLFTIWQIYHIKYFHLLEKCFLNDCLQISITFHFFFFLPCLYILNVYRDQTAILDYEE